MAHKLKAELIPLTKRERLMADRAYFANRIELLVRLKRLRLKAAKVKEGGQPATVESRLMVRSG